MNAWEIKDTLKIVKMPKKYLICNNNSNAIVFIFDSYSKSKIFKK